MNIVYTRLKHIGDSLMIVPALRYLRKKYQDATITLLQRSPLGVELMKNCPYIDRQLVYRNRSFKERLRIIRELRKLKPDLFFVSPQEFYKVPEAWLGGAKKIIGYTSSIERNQKHKVRCSWLIDRKLNFPAANDVSEVELNLRLAMLGERTEFSRDEMMLEYSWISAEALQQACEFRNNLIGERSFVCIAPFSNDTSKNCSPEKFAEFINLFRQHSDLPVILTGGANQAEQAEKMVSDENQIFSATGKMPIEISAALISQASLFIGNDSGPAHIASAVHVPAIVFYRSDVHGRWHDSSSFAPRVELITENNSMEAFSMQKVCDIAVKLLSGN